MVVEIVISPYRRSALNVRLRTGCTVRTCRLRERENDRMGERRREEKKKGQRRREEVRGEEKKRKERR